MKKFRSRREKRLLKKVRSIGCILLMVVLLFKVTMVEAGSNDSIIMKNRVDGIYAISTIGGVDRIFYLNMYTLNDRVAYCIEIGVDITSDIYNSTYDFNVSNLKSGQIEYIRNVSYFGYGYKDHNEVEYYMAAQEIIWEYLSGVQVNWTNVLDVNGDRININRYKNEIIRLVNKYFRGINLQEYTENMEVNGGDELIINDANASLEYYDVLAGSNSSAKIEDAKLNIYFDTDYVGEERITLKRKKAYSYDSALYYQGNSQKLISNGNIDDDIVLVFDVNGKSISFELVDSIEIEHNNQFDYLGINFELYSSDGELLSIVSSDEMGKLIVNNLPYGEYYLKQSSTNDAYLLSDKVQYFEVTDANNVVFLEVEPIINEVEILKLYGEEDKLLKESGIIFDIYNIDETFYKSIITADDGACFVELPYGEYIIKQKNSSIGYEKVDDFYIDARKDNDEVLSYTLVDQAIKVNFSILTKDSNGGLILESGISYKIKKGDEYLEFDNVNEFRSVDGVMILPEKINYGDYVIEVINNSVNYENEFKEIKFRIDDSSNVIFQDGELSLVVDINYGVVTESVLINSYKEEVFYEDNSYYYDYVKMNNAELELIADQDIVVNREIIYKKGDKIRDIVTNENGRYVIDNIYLGNYCLVDKSNNKECFEVLKGDSLEVDYVNKLAKGKVNIQNLSSDLNYIMGTNIEVKNEDGQVVFIGVTNEEGLIKINDLVYGGYCFKERSVSDEYLINDEEVCFVVDNAEVLELEIVNKKIGKKLINVPNTFSDKQSIRKLLVLGLMLVGGIIYKIKISRKYS